jgi:hypothetical protein
VRKPRPGTTLLDLLFSVLFKRTKGKIMHFLFPFQYVAHYPLNLFTSGRSLLTIAAYAAETTREQNRKKKFSGKNSLEYCVCGRYNSTRFQYFVAAMIVIGVLVFHYDCNVCLFSSFPPPAPYLLLSRSTVSPQ